MQDITRDNVRDVASTLAHHWVGSDPVKDREGVRRIITAYPTAMRTALCALILWRLEGQGFYTAAGAFESMLFDMAGIEPDELEADFYAPTIITHANLDVATNG